MGCIGTHTHTHTEPKIPNSGMFRCTVTVRGWDFEGSGNSKKKAKLAAAEAALKYLNNIQNLRSEPIPLADSDGQSQSHQNDVGELPYNSPIIVSLVSVTSLDK